MTQANGNTTGKICMVTGATSGIGEVTARALAQMGATVIVVGRSAERGAAALNRIKQATGNSSVELMLADLSAQAQVRQLAQQFKRKYQRLDVLVNNAGAVFTKRQESVDGIEMTFALNHLGYFLLTNLLLDRLKVEDTPARIVNVSSAAHQRARMNFEDLQSRQGYDGWSAYGQSKLANLLFTYELARLEGTGVTVNALHPGVVATNFGESNRGVARLVMKSVHTVALSPAEGAQTVIYLASSPDVEGVTGKYFVKEKAVQSSEASYDQVAAQRLWQVSEELAGLAVSV